MKLGFFFAAAECLSILGCLRSFAQPVPHHIAAVTVGADQVVTLALDATTSNLFLLPSSVFRQYTQMFDLFPVDSSPNLVNWTRQAMLLRTNSNSSPVFYIETNDSLVPARFYRTSTNYLITTFPKPRGPYDVGTLSRMLTDSSRSNRYGIKTNSSFMSTFWYPADVKAGDLPGHYNDRAVAVDRDFYSFFSWPIQWTNIIPRIVAHAVLALPLASGTHRFPVILHSHGYTGDRMLNSHLAAELASHGYIVAAVDHEDCHATVYPDARGVRYVPPGSLSDLGPIARSRVKDIQYLLGDLSEIDRSDPILSGGLDLDRIAVMGVSFGGGAAAEVLQMESRIRCGVLLEPVTGTNYGHVDTQPLGKPFLTMNGTVSVHTDIIPSTAEFTAISKNFYDRAASNAIWLKIAGLNHMGFLDLAWDREATSNSRSGSEAMVACVLWTFDTYLKGESPAFPTNAPIASVQRK